MEEACQNFRTYLHSSGVAEALSSTLLSLYRLNKKPTNPVEYLRQNLPPPIPETIAGLQAELDDLNKDIEKLTKMLPRELRPDRKDLDGAESVMTESGWTDITEATGFTGITEVTEATTDFNELESILEEGESVISEATTVATKM